MIDVYQAATQMTDESGQTYPLHINTLLDNAHRRRRATTASSPPTCTPTPATTPGQQAIVNAALATGVPVVSARQMLTWLDGRNGSSFEDLAWNGGDAHVLDRASAPAPTACRRCCRRRAPSGSLAGADARRRPPSPSRPRRSRASSTRSSPPTAGAYAATYDVDTTARRRSAPSSAVPGGRRHRHRHLDDRRAGDLAGRLRHERRSARPRS